MFGMFITSLISITKCKLSCKAIDGRMPDTTYFQERKRGDMLNPENKRHLEVNFNPTWERGSKTQRVTSVYYLEIGRPISYWFLENFLRLRILALLHLKWEMSFRRMSPIKLIVTFFSSCFKVEKCAVISFTYFFFPRWYKYFYLINKLINSSATFMEKRIAVKNETTIRNALKKFDTFTEWRNSNF